MKDLRKRKAAQPEPEPEPVAFYNFQTHQMRWAKPTVYAEIVAVDVPELPFYTAPPQPIEQLKAERDAAVFALEHQRQFYARYMPTDAAPKDRLREVEAERDALLEALQNVMGILSKAESNASGNLEWDYVHSCVGKARAALKAREVKP